MVQRILLKSYSTSGSKTLSASTSKCDLQNWVTFTLPNTLESLTKAPESIDNSNSTSDTQLVLTGKWVTVERVIGSKGDDQILGNSLDNYIDPGVGNSYLEGGNGSDIYIVRSTYGEENITTML